MVLQAVEEYLLREEKKVIDWSIIEIEMSQDWNDCLLWTNSERKKTWAELTHTTLMAASVKKL